MEYCDIAPRRIGRPKVIPEEFVPGVIRVYKAGSGYRSISHCLENEGIIASPSTVRRLIKEEFRKRRKPKVKRWHIPVHRNNPVSGKAEVVVWHWCKSSSR